MPECSVKGCKNTSKAKLKKKTVSFYSIPKLPWLKERRQLWIQFTGRGFNKDGTPWQPSRHSKICSEHFVSGEKSEDPRKVNYNPTLLGPGSGTSAPNNNDGLADLSNQSGDGDNVNIAIATDDKNGLKLPLNQMVCLICSSKSETKSTQTPTCIKNWTMFCNQILKSHHQTQRFLKLFRSLDNLTICNSCMALITSAVTKDKELIDIERKVISLQQQLMKVLWELQTRVEDFYQEMRNIGQLISTTDITAPLKQSDAGCSKIGNKGSNYAIVNFRDRVLGNVEKLQEFGEGLERKTNCTVEEKPSKLVDLVTTVVKEEADDWGIGEDTQQMSRNYGQDPYDDGDNDEKHGEEKGDETVSLQPKSTESIPKKDTEPCSGSGTKKVENGDERRKQFFCDICGKGFIAEFTLKCHLWWNHKSKKEQEESIRKGDVDPWTEKYGRKQGPDLLQCSKCGKQFSFPYTLKAHEKTHEEVRERVMCSTCGRQILPSHFKQHQKICNNREKASTNGSATSFKCDICGNSYTNKVSYKVHTRNHSAGKSFLCSQCPKAFTTFALLKRHEMSHSGERKFVCGKGCGGGFKSQRNRKRHEAKCNGRGTPLRKRAIQVAPPTYSELSPRER